MTEQNALSDAQIRRLLEQRARRADMTGLLAEITGQISGEPQHRTTIRASALGWVAGLATAAVLLLAVGALLFRGPTGPSGPPASTSPSPTPSPEASGSARPGQPLAPAGLDAPPLDAGTWSTVAFDPGITFTVPADRWSSGLDLPQQVYLRAHLPGAPADEFDAWTIVRLKDVYTDPCGLGGAGATEPWTDGADTFFTWLQEQSPVDLGTPIDATVLGRPAKVIELEVPPDAFAECADGYLPIATVEAGPSGQVAIPRIGQRFRMAAVDDGGRTLLVLTFGAPERWDALVAATDQVLATLEFQ
jgi:hypothetical protein